MPDDLRPLRPGRYFSESELADHARRVLDMNGLTQAAAADRLGVHRQEVHMAVNFDKYPDRGGSIRRRILAVLGHRRVSDPTYSRVLFDSEGSDE